MMVGLTHKARRRPLAALENKKGHPLFMLVLKNYSLKVDLQKGQFKFEVNSQGALVLPDIKASPIYINSEKSSALRAKQGVRK
jgi:hypothetical protein